MTRSIYARRIVLPNLMMNVVVVVFAEVENRVYKRCAHLAIDVLSSQKDNDIVKEVQSLFLSILDRYLKYLPYVYSPQHLRRTTQTPRGGRCVHFSAMTKTYSAIFQLRRKKTEFIPPLAARAVRAVRPPVDGLSQEPF